MYTAYWIRLTRFHYKDLLLSNQVKERSKKKLITFAILTAISNLYKYATREQYIDGVLRRVHLYGLRLHFDLNVDENWKNGIEGEITREIAIERNIYHLHAHTTSLSPSPSPTHSHTHNAITIKC